MASSNVDIKAILAAAHDQAQANLKAAVEADAAGGSSGTGTLSNLYGKVDNTFINTFIRNAGKFFDDQAKAYDNLTYSAALNRDGKNARIDTWNNLSYQAGIIKNFILENKGSLDWNQDWEDLLAYTSSFDKNVRDMNASFDEKYAYFDQFENENDWLWFEKYNGNNSDDLLKMMEGLEDGDEKTWLDNYAQQVYLSELPGLDLNKAQSKVDYLENLLDVYRKNTRFFTNEQGQRWVAEIEAAYGGEDGLLQAISREKQRITYASWVQENEAGAKKFGAVPELPDFAEKSGFNPEITDLGYRYINADLGGRIDLEQKYGTYVSEMGYRSFDALSDEEKAIYNYYMNTGDRQSAADYLKYIQGSLNERKGMDLADDFEQAPWLRYAYGGVAGLDQFRSGMEGFGDMIAGREGYKSPSAIQYAAAGIREDLADEGKKLPEWMGGGTWGQAAFDTITTSANMAPSILMSTVVGLANPAAGTAVGRGLMGASAAGSGYRDMLNRGYSVDQARTYGALVGTAEVFMEKFLGGIGKLGSKPAAAIAKWAGNLDNALMNFAVRIAGNGMSEALEEGLQELVDTWLQRQITKEDFQYDTAEALYSSLLGFATGGLFEAPNAAIDIGTRIGQGRDVIDSDGAGALVKMGRESADADVQATAKWVDNHRSAYNLGKLKQSVEADIHSQNAADISASLVAKGMNKKSADQTAEAMARILESGSEADLRLLVSETDPVIGQTMREVMLQGAPVQQRIQSLRSATGMSRTISQAAAAYGNQSEAVKQVYKMGEDATGKNISVDDFEYGFQRAYNIGREGGNVEALTEEIAPGLNQQQRQAAYNIGRDAVAREKAEFAKRAGAEPSGVHILNEDGSVGDEVRITEIASMDGKTVAYKLSDGRTVREDQLSFSGDNAVLDTVKDLGLDVETANTMIRGSSTINKADSLIAQGIEDAYRYGSHGYSMDRLLKDSESAGILTEEMRQAAYDAGKNKPAKAKPSKAKPKTRGTKPGVYFDSGNGQVKAYDLKSTRQLKDTQKAGVQTAVVLQRLGIGTDFYFFESYVKDGKRVYRDEKGVERPAPNGWYDPNDGSIHIDLNAGNDGQGLTLYTMAHELTHFIEQWSQDKYKVLADFLIKNYEKGRSVDDLVHLKQEALSQGRDKPVSYEEAYSEVIADSMEAMLSDGNVLEKLAELKQQDEGLVRKMKVFFDNFVKKIRSIYADLKPESAESQLVQEMKEQFEQLQQLFAEALVGAGENIRNAEVQKNTTREGGKEADVERQFSIRKDIVDVNGKQYDDVVELEYSTFNKIKRHTKAWLSFIRNNLIKQKITVYNSNGDPEIIEFAKENERVQKTGSNSFRRVLGELERIVGDTRKLVVANAVEVAQISALKKHNPPDGHQWLDQNGWDERWAYVMTSDGTIHTAVLQIAKTRDGRNLLYGVNVDITKGVSIDKSATSVRAKKQAQPAVKIPTPSGKGTVTQPATKVNQNSGNTQNQDRPTAPITNRALLANALESTTQDETELTRLREYRMSIDYLNEQETKLTELRSQIREISFGKGPRDTARLKQLQEEATKTANRINVADKKLLRLETTKPLQRVLEREKGKAHKQAQAKNKQILEQQRESRNKTAVRHKIQRVVTELNKLLLNGDKKHHVPESLKKAVADALALVNMDTVGAEERVAKYRDLIAKETDPDKIDAYTVTMENILRQSEKMGQRLKDLRDAYEEISKSDDPDIANAYDPVIAGSLQELAGSIGNTALKDMSMAQLQDVYDMYTMVLTRVRDSNRSFQDARNKTIADRASAVVREIRAVGGDHKVRASMLDPARKFFWNNLKPVYAFETIGSDALREAFNTVRKGEDVWAVDVSEARGFYLEKAKKYGYHSWDFKKKYRFESESGQSFELTLEQILSLYAYSRREQAHEHLRLGGFVFDSDIETEAEYTDSKNPIKKLKSKVIKYKVNTADAHQIGPETLSEIIGTLSKEQVAFVEEMQDYLSATMGAKGNEVTMQMYGVKLFKEKHYFPLKSAKQFLFEQNEVSGEVRLKNSGFTNKVVTKANNPVILSNFMEVWANHVNDMSMYHAFVLPLEDFNRIFNYNSPKKENIPSISVKGTLQSAYSPAAVSYVKNLITDLNGGARTDSTTGLPNKLMGIFKKGAVFASASVVIQQPSAVARAAAVMDLHWFVGRKIDRKSHAKLWEEVKQYAPVAVIKEMGYFDTNMGKSSVDYITGREYDGFWEKSKATITDSDYRDELLSRAPAYADEMAWCAIWNAVKRETRAKFPGMDTKSEAFLTKAGERFTEVITKTQVYDSVLARSANMRSKDTGMKMATAFMAEPTTSINMIGDALLKGKRGQKKLGAKVIGAVVASQILNAFLVAWVYAGRDDDEEKTYWEKYAKSFVSSLIDDINPATYIPFIKDIMSIIQGYEVERSDMAVFSDLWNAWKQLDKEDVSAWRKVEGFVGSICQIFGLPVKNIMRDVRAIWQTYDTFVNGEKGTDTGMKYAIAEGVTGGTVSNPRQLYYARRDGDAEHAARVEGRYDDADSADAAVRTAIRELYLEGELDLATARNHLVAYGGMDVDEAHWQMDEWKYLKEHGNDADYGKYNDFYAAVESGENLEAVIKTYTDNGVELKTLTSQLTEHFKPLYVKMSDAEREAFDQKLGETLMLLGYNQREADDILWNWEFKAQYGFEWEDRKKLYMSGDVSESEMRTILSTAGGLSKSEIDKELWAWDFEIEHGFSWSDRKQVYLDGEISKSELSTLLVKYGNYTPEDAGYQIEAYEWEANGLEGATVARVKDYNLYCKNIQLSKDKYLEIRIFSSAVEGEKDENGKTIKYSAVDKIMAKMKAMGLSRQQKEALAQCFNWSKSTLNHITSNGLW